MKIMFIGAAHEVTGSCHYVEACGVRFLVDYGMEQGFDLYEPVDLPVAPGDIDFVLLTHAHIDHSGLLPLLYKRGFHGTIYTTKATRDLCEIMLRDSAHIQEFEAEWKNKKARRSGTPEVIPMYTVEDAYEVMHQFVGVDYHNTISPSDGITVCFTDVGHLLGSAAITVTITEEGVTKRLVFSGDVGNLDQPIIRDPEAVDGGDYLIIESTYGDRNHEVRKEWLPTLVRVLRDTFSAGGNLIIPSFAVGRTQEMLYFFRQIKEQNLLPEYADFPVYVDSPLAVSATQVFEKNEYSCYDEEAIALLKAGVNPLQFPGLNLSITSEDSKAINKDTKPKVIISASGMCEAGRIKHHLKYNLWRPESTILFVGYQANRTLGRALVEGAESVHIFGDEVIVRAHIETMNGVSGHADQSGLLDWVRQMEHKPKQIYVVHGDDQVTDHFAMLLTQTFGIPAYAPYSGDSFDLTDASFLSQGSRQKVTRNKSRRRSDTVYGRLLDTGDRLISVIHKNEGVSNKDLAKFTSQLEALIEKWDR